VIDSYQNPNLPAGSPPFMYGGGKLGTYSYWDVCNSNPTYPGSAPILPDPYPPQDPNHPQQFEFYNHSQHPTMPSFLWYV
jgi:hypothetical protein